MRGEPRILVFEPYWDAIYGNQRYLRMLVAGMAADGFDIHVVVPRRGALSESLAEEQVSLHVLDESAASDRVGSGSVRAVASAAIAMHRIIRRIRPDSVHANNLRSVLCSGPGARLANIPLLWYIKSMDDPRVARLAMRLATRRVAIGHELLRRLEQEESHVVSDDDIVPLGTPDVGVVRDRSDMRATLGILSDRPTVLLAASINPNKGIHHGIEAVSRLVTSGADPLLLVAGEARGNAGTDYLRTLTARVEELRLSKNVRFLGYRDDVPDLLSASDLFLLPSAKEGVPRSIIEAMQCGVPVVASRTGGIPETVLEGETGHVVPIGDVGAITQRLGELLDNPVRRRTFGAAALTRSSLYSIERNVSTIGGIHRHLIAGQQPVGRQ